MPMKTSAFYNIAKEYADTIKQLKPEYAPAGARLCMVQTDSQQLITGVTGIRIVNDTAVEVTAEENTINKMIATKNTKASQMMTINIEDGAVQTISEDALRMLVDANPVNKQCMIASSEEEEASVADLLPSAGQSDLGAPAEFVSGFEFDESNPFFEPAAAEDEPAQPSTAHPNTADPKFLYNQPGQQSQPQQPQGFPQGMPQQGGYQQMPQQGGYGMPQQGGYQQMPQQGGYGMPQQGGYQQMPQQGGYGMPQQGYPQQGGMPQQGYPQQGAGFPQQSAAYPQQGGYGMPQQGAAYPQQGAGFPQQGASFPQQGAQASGYVGQPYQPTQSVYTNNSLYQNGGSVHLGADTSVMVSQYLGQKGSAFKKRLADLVDDEDDAEIDAILNGDDEEEEDDGSNNATMSKKDMQRLANEQKKLAKQNAKNKQ